MFYSLRLEMIFWIRGSRLPDGGFGLLSISGCNKLSWDPREGIRVLAGLTAARTVSR